MKRPGTLRRTWRSRKAPPEALLTEAGWIAQVRRQPVLYSNTEPSTGPFTTAGHHVIPQQTLRNTAGVRGKPEWMVVWDPRVGLHVSKRRHERHHSGHEKIPRAALPAAVFEFAAEWGLTWYLDKHYPKETHA